MHDQHTREEHDLLGVRRVPVTVYYGIHTLRAVENFAITGKTLSACPEIIVALASIKQAAAFANFELGKLGAITKDAIVAACEEIRSGALHCGFQINGTSIPVNPGQSFH